MRLNRYVSDMVPSPTTWFETSLARELCHIGESSTESCQARSPTAHASP